MASETSGNYRHGDSEGVILRRNMDNLQVEAYRGNGRWEYVETWRWLTETDLIDSAEAEAAMKRIDRERAARNAS